MADPTVRRIPCERCRALVSVDAIAPRVRCPYCGHEQALRAVYDELRDYEAAVGQVLGAAEHEHQRAAAWKQWTQVDPGKNLKLAVGLILGAPMALAVLVFLSSELGLLQASGPGFGLAMMGACYAFVLAYLVWYFAKRKRVAAQPVTAGGTQVACPSCGAPGMLTPGIASS